MQFQTLTAIVKAFLKKPDSNLAQQIVQQVLERRPSSAIRRTCAIERSSTGVCCRPRIPRRGGTSFWPHVPPISIPLTTVPPAVLDELVSELSSLASAYHRPAATFIGKARIGADGVRNGQVGEAEDDITREKALATVVQGQKSENLLDFGDDDVELPVKNGNGAGALGAFERAG